MFVLFFFFWIILCGRAAWETCLFGLATATAAFVFLRRFCQWSLEREKLAYRLFFPCAAFFLLLLAESFRSNLHVLGLILKNEEQSLHPQLLLIDPAVKSHAAKTALACALSLSPGTLAVRITEDRFLVHALTDTIAAQVHHSPLERALVRMERIAAEGRNSDV